MKVGVLKRLKHRMMLRSRKKKFEFFLNEVCGGIWPEILDVGVADVEYSPYDNFLEKKCPHPERISVLSIFPLEEFKKRYPKIRTHVYDKGQFPFNDNSFDIIHCNAVIEHVGDECSQIEFMKEIARVGRIFFLTTPSRLFPLEMHTNIPLVHYLSRSMQDKIFTWVGKEWAAGDYMHLLSANDLARELRTAGINDFQIITNRFMGIPLHYYVIGRKSHYEGAVQNYGG